MPKNSYVAFVMDNSEREILRVNADGSVTADWLAVEEMAARVPGVGGDGGVAGLAHAFLDAHNRAFREVPMADAERIAEEAVKSWEPA
jgi:hypothetical protein